MAEIRTTRMRLVQWTEGTDSPQRVDFNETFLNIETLAAIDQQGPKDSRPTPNKTGMYYFATDEGILYRSDGLTWAVVGSSTLSHLIRAARTDSVSLTIQAIPSQTSDLHRIVSTAGATLFRVRPNGDVLAGPLRVSQAARTTTSADTVPTDSAATLDNNSGSMWGLTAKNTTGNTAGFYRAVRGTTTVFQVAPDGSIVTPAVKLGSEPTDDSHAVRRTDLTTAITGARYDINGENITGTLSVARGGTGRTTAPTNGYLRGNSSGVYETMTPTGVRNDIGAATAEHGHALTDANITGTLPVNQGGTGVTTVSAARDALGVPASTTAITAGPGLTGGGDLTANRTLQVVFEGNGSASTVARSDHGHSLADDNIVGTLPVGQGGTGATSAAAARTNLGVAPTIHGHALTDSNITGTLPVAQGGTGRTSITQGTYLRGNGTAEVTMRAPGDVLADIGGMPRDVETLPANQNINNWTTSGKWVPSSLANVTSSNGYPTAVTQSVVHLEHTQVSSTYAAQTLTMAYNNMTWRRTMRNGTWYTWEQYPRTPFTQGTGIGATGWDSQSGGQVVVPLNDGRYGCSLGVRLLRTGSTFTQGAAMMTHGYVDTTYRPVTNASLFPIFVGGTLGMGQINWVNGQFSARTLSGDVSMSSGSFIEFSYTWVSNGP